MNSWSNQDKNTLLEALKAHGVSNINLIAEALPHKSIYDIRSTISKYENLALGSLARGKSTGNNAPLDKWIEIIQQNSKRNTINIISRVLKYIALFEERQDSNVNIKDCYTVLSDLCSGKATKETNQETQFFLNECFAELAREVRTENNEDKIEFLKKLKFDGASTTISRTYQRKDQNAIVTDSEVNVCKVPVKLLK